MVQITDNNNYNNSKYEHYFELYSVELSPFQKHAIQGIVDGNHVLVTAATGSGKTLPAEFAIQHFVNQGKRVIYCSPIKALSNQKTFDFRNKYPHISFGLLTGDIKSNPSAQVLIMTTEILMNKLYNNGSKTAFACDNGVFFNQSSLSFEMDIDSELGCVIFDELHYINDEHRGHVWEQSIMMLPPHVQMVMLSATLDNPVKFAQWIEQRRPESEIPCDSESAIPCYSKSAIPCYSKSAIPCDSAIPCYSKSAIPCDSAIPCGSESAIPCDSAIPCGSESAIPCDSAIPCGSESAIPCKQVILCSTDKRIVPLSHYMYLCSTEGLFKKLKCKETEQRVKHSLNKCLPLQSENGIFNDAVYKESKWVLDLMSANQVFMKRKNVLNQLATHMYDNAMLPAIAFVFSRKLVEQCAQDIDVRVLEDDSKVIYIVREECEAVIRRLPNWREYASLPEYQELVRLLEKGIGIHHSGMIPVLREIVELMISKKYIKLLFATESFAIGLDCPIRTAVFLGLQKHTNDGSRYLYSHEYTQMAGRAGRRGIDILGNVIHCNNLFDLPALNVYKELLCGKPQTLVSKFQLYYPVVFNECNVQNSMYQQEIAKMRKGLEQELAKVEAQIAKKEDGFIYLNTNRELLVEYYELNVQMKMAANKKRKELETKMRKMKEQNNYLDKDINYYCEYLKLLDTKKTVCENIKNNDAYIDSCIAALKDVLHEFGITEPIRCSEINPVLFSLIYTDICVMNQVELATFFSVFSRNRESENCSEFQYKFLESAATKIQNAENMRGIHVKENGLGPFCYELVDIIPQWCECTDEQQCKQILGQLSISIGDFIKALLKISTIAKELSTIDYVVENTVFMHNLSKIDELILKFVATNQSLYIHS